MVKVKNGSEKGADNREIYVYDYVTEEMGG